MNHQLRRINTTNIAAWVRINYNHQKGKKNIATTLICFQRRNLLKEQKVIKNSKVTARTPRYQSLIWLKVSLQTGQAGVKKVYQLKTQINSQAEK